MQNFVQSGENVTVPAPSTITSGSGVLIGDLFGVATGSAAISEPVVLSTVGVFTLAKVSTDDVAVGACVYWDSGQSLVTTTSASNTLIGVSIAAAGNPSGTVNVRLNGAF